jgi:uncharacterized protein
MRASNESTSLEIPMRNLIVTSLAILIILQGKAWADMNEPTSRTPVIQVVGTGEVHAKPDIATMTIGVTIEDGSAQNAVAKNTAAVTKVIAELEAAAIAKKDIQTSNFSIYPQNRIEGNDKHQVTVYRVSNTVSVTIRDLEKVGDVLTRIVAAGSNQISGPHFSVAEPEKFLAEARKKAVENALSKAQTYASAAGVKLGQIREISEEQISGPSFAKFRAAAPSTAQIPIEAGEQNLQAQIALVIELKP